MQTIYLIYLFIIGLIFGSFASVLIHRWFNKKPGILNGRSECPNCKHRLGFMDLIPLLSYVTSLGKCRYCKNKISSVYPLLEVSMGILFLLSGIYLTDFELIMSGNYIEIIRLCFFLFISFVIVTFTFYDILYMEIPDEIMIPGIIFIFLLLIVASVSKDFNLFGFYKDFDNVLLSIPLINGILGSLVIFLFFLAQIMVSDGAWMGGGDLRIAVFMGLVGGFKIAVLGLMLAYMIGSVFGILILLKTKSKDTAIPFGPYLGAGLFLSLLFYDKIIFWYLNIL
ncbi:MAG: prepilin peptidase [Candidatus Gracilibacteria bacterium]|nr:prepilin peptidase [Candidatus Gracilibacteria bacterium]